MSEGRVDRRSRTSSAITAEQTVEDELLAADMKGFRRPPERPIGSVSTSNKRGPSSQGGNTAAFKVPDCLLGAEGIALIDHPKMKFDEDPSGSVKGKIIVFGKKALVESKNDCKPLGSIRYLCQNRQDGGFSCKLELDAMTIKFHREKRPSRFSSSWKKKLNVFITSNETTGSKLRLFGFFTPGPKAANGTTFHLFHGERKKPTEYCRIDEATKIFGLFSSGGPLVITKTNDVHHALPGIHNIITDGCVSVDFGPGLNDLDRLILMILTIFIKSDTLSGLAPDQWRKQNGEAKQQWLNYMDQGLATLM